MNISLFIKKLNYIFATMKDDKALTFLYGVLLGLCLGILVSSWALSEVNKDLEKIIKKNSLIK